MQNIVVNFTSSAEGLQPGIEGLVQLEVADKKVADQAKKTMDAYQNRDKNIASTAKATITQLDQLSTAFKNLDKIVAGGASADALKKLQDQISGTSDDFQKLSVVIDFAKKKLTALKPNSQEWKDLSAQLSTAEKALKGFSDENGKTDSKVKSLRTQLKELKQELAVMEEQGLDNTKQFENMQVAAGKLEDQIGDTARRVRALASDTANIDAVVESVQLMGSGFQFAAGAQALFGSEDEELQKTLVRLNGIMAITTAIQQILQGLQKQSIVVIKAEAIAQGFLNFIKTGSIKATTQQTVATEANTAATVEQTEATVATAVATTGASVAMSVFRAALIATGIGAIVIALVMLAQKISEVASNAKAAAAAKREFDAAMKEGTDYLDAEVTGIENSNKKILASMKERGASNDEMAAQDIKNLQLVQDARGRSLDVLKSTYYDEKTIKNLSAEDYKALGDKILTLESTISQGQADIIDKIADKQRQSYLDSLKSATAYAEGRLSIVKKGSRDELNAQIAAIKVAQTEQLANANLTAGERARLEAEGNRKILTLREDFHISQLLKEKNFMDAQVASQEMGSEQQFKAKLYSLQKQEEIDEASAQKEIEDEAKLTAALQKIRAEYFQNREEMIKAENKRLAENSINAEIAGINSNIAQLQLAGADATNQHLLDAKKDLLDKQAALEVLNVQASIDTEQNKAARIKAIYSKELADKKALEDERKKAEIGEGKDSALSIYDREIAKQNLVLENEKSTERQKIAAQERIFDLTDGRIRAEELANQQLYDSQLESFTEYLARKEELQTAHDQNDQEREKYHQDRLIQIRDFALQTFSSFANVFAGITQQHNQDEIEQIQALYDQKKISETEYQNRMKAVKRKEAEDAKAMAVFQTLIQQGPVVLKGFKEGGFAGIVAAFALFFSMLGAVQGAKVPGFKDGVIDIDGPGTTTSDSIPVFLSRGETVTTAAQTSKHKEVLKAIHEDRYGQYLVQHELPKLYTNMSAQTAPQFIQTITHEAPEPINYERMAKAIAGELANNPQVALHVDERGFHISIKKGAELIDYVNKKLNT
jgi:hypothetical protein